MVLIEKDLLLTLKLEAEIETMLEVSLLLKMTCSADRDSVKILVTSKESYDRVRVVL